jgi:U32 family peptidase
VIFILLNYYCYEDIFIRRKISKFHMWESKAYLLVLICAFYIFTASSFSVNRVSPRRKRISSLSSSSAELRKNVGLYSEFGTEVGKQARIESIAASSTLKSGKLYKPEVLAPAGGWPQLKAAISNGADAVYFGLQQGFNARARASNFNIDELEEVMNYLHDRGAKGYLVVNILVFDSEIERLKELVPRIASAGVDALIMQDIGAAALVHSIAPNLPIHGSTQMSITDAKGIEFTQRLGLGIDRIVIGRELSISEISSISQSAPVEIEAFVHGALCVSYSGQCFSSEAWGGRSANRGQCAQACRMPYGLIVNGRMYNTYTYAEIYENWTYLIRFICPISSGSLTNMIDDAKYLLSPQDLMAVDLVPDLIKAGYMLLLLV